VRNTRVEVRVLRAGQSCSEQVVVDRGVVSDECWCFRGTVLVGKSIDAAQSRRVWETLEGKQDALEELVTLGRRGGACNSCTVE
jgi:hypothetical protein